MIPKAYAYILRRRDDEWQILVFTHRDFPDQGTQVPGGTIEAGEMPAAAVLREIEEESGLRGLTVDREVAVVEHYSERYREWQRRHFFLLLAPSNVPESWSHVVSSGNGARDKDLIFCYEWWPLERATQAIAGGKGEALLMLGL